MQLSAPPAAADLAAILEAAGAMLIACDLKGTVRVFNPAAECLLGWNAAEVVGHHSPQLWHDRDEMVRRAAELSEELGRTVSADFEVFTAKAHEPRGESREWTFIRKDGVRFPLQLVVSAVRDANGTITGYVGTAQDIGQRLQAEQERDRLFDLSLDMLCVANKDGYFTRVNPAFSRILGWSEKELVGRPFLELVDPVDQRKTLQELDQLTAGQPSLTFENRYLCKDRSRRILSWTGVPQPDGLVFATARDVTDLRQAQEEVRRSQQELAITLRSIGDGVIATDVQRRITRMNPVAELLTGWKEVEAVGRPIDEVYQIVDEVTHRSVAICVDAVLAMETVQGLANHLVLIARDGNERPISDSAAPIRNDMGDISGVVLIFRDASSERDLQNELQRLNVELELRVDERTKELTKEQRRLRHGNLILESVASEATLSETLDMIVRFVTDEELATRSGILLFEEKSDQLHLAAQRNLPEDFDESLLQRPHGTQSNWIWQAVLTGKRVVVEDLSTASFERGEQQSRRNDLRAAWVEPIVADNGGVLGLVVTFREQIGPPGHEEATCVKCACSLARVAIERARARSALESSETRYRTLLERIPATVFVYDRESLAYLAVSDQAVAEYGYSREEFARMTVEDIRPREDVPALRKLLKESGTGFENCGMWRHRKKDGSLIDVEIKTHGLELAGGLACIVLAQDVTEQLRAENALRRSEALNQSILQSSLDCIVTMSEAGEIVEFNRAAEQVFGISRAKAVGRPIAELINPTDLQVEHKRGLAQYLATGGERIICRRIRTTALRSNGEVFPVELSVVPLEVDGERHFTAFLRDMTLAVSAEQELQRTMELLQAVADGTTDAVFVKDRHGRYLLFNKAAAKFTGREVDEVLGKNDTFVYGDERGRKVMENDRLVMQSNQPHTVEDELTAAGITRCYHSTKAPLRDAQGNVVGMIGIARDITERKRMESTLRASEERYRSIVEHSPDVMFVNRDNCITFINQAGLDLLRASTTADVLGRSPLEFFHPHDHSQIQGRIAQLLAAPGVIPVIEERMIALDGTVIDVDVQAASYYGDGKLEIQVVCRNVSARKRAERDLKRNVRHAEFSAAVGMALTHLPTLPEMLHSCAEAMVSHLDAAFARVWTLNAQEGVLELQASAGIYTRLDGTHARVPVGQKKIGRIASTKLPYLTNSVLDDPQIGDPEWARAQGFISFAGYPLLIEGRCVGVVAMFARETLEQDTLEYLAMAANGIAQNIKRKQSEAMLADLNKTLEMRVRERTLALEESEQFNRATLDALSAHVAVVDRDGNIVATNAEWRKFALENQIAFQSVSEGANYLAVCDAAAKRGDADAAKVAASLREVLAGQRTAWQFEYPCHSPSERRWFICQVTQGHNGQQLHAVVAHENVTSIKLVQEELRTEKEKAMQASIAKSEFLATMSHELRTPLNGILGMNALILRTDLDERQRRFAEACRASGKLLTQLINDVLDVSKIEAGKLELDPRPCEIEAVVYDVVDILTNSAHQKGITLKCRLSQSACVSALADDNRLRQILVNLVGNAIKFTSSGGVSIVGDRIDQPSGHSRLRIEVTDTGIGIPRERIDRLFKAFSQVDSSTTRQFGGTGLGLTICAQLVALMDGEIGVESQIGVGSIFWFEIPLEMIQSDKAGRRWQSVATAQVLTVDCPDSTLAQVAECVSTWDCHCVEVQTVSEALDVLHGLAATEPVMSVVLSSIRALEGDPVLVPQLVDHCPGRVVALLTAQDEPSAQKMRSLGIVSTLQEPLRPSELFETLTSLLLSINSDEVADREPPEFVRPVPPPGKLVGHLLVAEDNQINQMYMVELLKILGCTCDVVVNGEEVLSALEHGRYDVILMDCQMPEMDGFTAAREIRKREANAKSPQHIPIVAVTANALKGDCERCLDAGMDAYVIKPIQGEQLRMVLESYLAPPQPTKPTANDAM